MKMLVDAHCHLDFPQFDADRDQVVERAKDIRIVNSTVDPDLVGKGLSLQERYDNVSCTLGFSASDLDEGRFRRMVALIRANSDRIAGLGEAGLDYYWVKDEKGRALEKAHFLELALLSRELGLPLIVHSRDAEEECIIMLEELKLRAMLHCFSGTIEQARRAIGFGCLISVPANVSEVKSRQRLAQALPLESLVLETDAPYLSPRRGERSEPAYVRQAAEKIAELKGVSAGQVEETTTENAMGFFRIKRW